MNDLGECFAPSRTLYHTYDFEPSGDPSLDTPRWEALTNAINSFVPRDKHCDVRIRDKAKSLALDAKFSPRNRSSSFLRQTFVYGETKSGVRVEYGNGYIVNWGGFGNPIRSTDKYPWFTRASMAPVPAWSTRLRPNMELTKDDYVVVWSDDDILDVAPHHKGGKQRPAEIHRINHQDGGGWVMDSDVVDALLTNPQLCKVDMLKQCGMENLVFGSTGVDNDDPDTPQIMCVSAQRCHGFRMENVNADETGCGAVGLQLCTDSRITYFNGVWQPNNRRVYAVVFGVCTGCVYTDSTWHNTRHMITSAGLQVSPTDGIRYGTARACQGRHLHQWISGDLLDSSFAGMDMHAESWGFELFDCHVHNAMFWDSPTEEFIAFSTRARNTRFVHCYVHSAMTQAKTFADRYYGQPATGFRVMGNDCQIINCHQDRGWRGVWIRPDIVSSEFVPQRTKIDGSIFENITGPVVYMDSDMIRGMEMNHCTARDSGGYSVPNGKPQFLASLLRLRGGGHKIRFNNLDRGPNLCSMDVDQMSARDIDLAFNSMRGYGVLNLGVYGANATDFSKRFATKNSCD